MPTIDQSWASTKPRTERPRPQALARRLAAEAIGTFWLVLGGCGAAVIAAGDEVPNAIGIAGVAGAFGLTVFTMAFAVGFISGGHFNPAVSVGLAVAGRFPARDVPAYVGAQLVGAIVASAVLAALASGAPGFDILASGFAANGYGAHSPGGYGATTAFLSEAVLTGGFLLVILGATDERSPAAFAPLAIGLALTLIHLVSIPIDNTSVNPARSTGPALFLGGWALSQLWLFWLAPLVGAAAAGLAGRWLFAHDDADQSPGPIGDTPVELMMSNAATDPTSQP
ncbi:aquaporin Z [Sphingomonas prati]|uniref:Aquaporin Z n=1 Tax=Sphingomonas prati TaxID=1843237 RepID=A0A7W9BSL5_9SPHN|nr:aquaporin Z [Sphingomonas prati]MBB5729374.1 aquaporin Z [Sphingomonas prati]GGE77901.1 aquaporin Z [Sphingomonas prati]